MDDVAAAFDPQLMFDFPDPYPMFAEMRRAQPVAHFTMLGRENYVVTRYDDVWAVLRDGDTYSSRANFEVGKFFGRTIIEMDGKEHARTRALVSAVFSARAIEALQPVITRLVHERIDTFTGAGGADHHLPRAGDRPHRGRAPGRLRALHALVARPDRLQQGPGEGARGVGPPAHLPAAAGPEPSRRAARRRDHEARHGDGGRRRAHRRRGDQLPPPPPSRRRRDHLAAHGQHVLRAPRRARGAPRAR